MSSTSHLRQRCGACCVTELRQVVVTPCVGDSTKQSVVSKLHPELAATCNSFTAVSRYGSLRQVGTWDQLTAGQGTAVVWASTSPTFAVLYAPHAAVPEFSGRFSRKKAKAREEEFARQSAIAAAAANAEQAVCVQVRFAALHLS